MTDEEEEFFVSGLFSGFPEISQCVVLNTCNRFELYFDGTDENIIPVQRELCAFKSADEKAVMENSFTYSGEDAITQLITLACGMDSMVLGEDEILRQIKEAYTKAHDKGRTGFEFNTIFKMAITAAKEIKTLTGLSMTPVSIGTLAAAEAARFKTEGGEVNVLIMGITGKIGLITAKNALAHGGIRLTGTTRAKDLKSLDVDGTQVPLYPFDERHSLFDGADVTDVTLSLLHEPENKCVKIQTHIPGEELIIERNADTFEDAVTAAVDAMKEKIVRIKEKKFEK